MDPEAAAPTTHAWAQPQPGDQLGHYTLVRTLGSGGMGVVFEAEDTESGRRVALKVLSHRLDAPQARDRFFREGRLAASINHPNSVYVFGTEEIAGIPVISMELVTGGTLQDRVRAKGPRPVGEAVDSILQIIAGLEAAQAMGILHRDIKPSNCYIAEDNSVKIGDFGLSISTSVRVEPSLTSTGAFLGTPAFSSPEQLRGEELNARSDMYSVGVTLYYLLTGRTPFEAKNAVALLSMVLEQNPPSPSKFRGDIPRELAKVILRCLEKQPGERFRTYAELVQALTPFGSDAPKPATLGLRLLAGMADLFLLSAISGACALLFLGQKYPWAFMGKPDTGWLLAWIVCWFGLMVLYYSLLEGLRGASLGKALFRLRVMDGNRQVPGVARAAIRAFIAIVLPAVPTTLLYGVFFGRLVGASPWVQVGVSCVNYLILALLFSTARRRNGYAAVHDLLTGTRVLSRGALPVRQTPQQQMTKAPDAVPEKMIGPYHILDELAQDAAGRWFLGYDLRLLRKVWIREYATESPEVAQALRNQSRPGRLRWLNGKRSPTEKWDAYEALSGAPLQKIIREAQPWSRVRFWLQDLAGELAAAHADRTLPALALDRVWITATDNAKILDFPAPGLAPAEMPLARDSSAFLASVANAALAGRESPPRADGAVPPIPIPLHARSFLSCLPGLAEGADIVNALKPLLAKPSYVSRLRRAAILGGCALLPVFVLFSTMIGTQMMNRWNQASPGLMQLNQLLHMRAAGVRMGPSSKPAPDEMYAVYIAANYRNVVTNPAAWSNAFSLALIKGEARQFAEHSVAEYPSLSPEQEADARKALQPVITNLKATDVALQANYIPFLIFTISWIFYVGVPAILAAAICKGGLIQFVAGVTYVRRDGDPASRPRIFWRALVAWAVFIPGMVLFGLLVPSLGALKAATLGWAAVALLAGISLSLPGRSIPDHLAGTWPVPR